MPIHFRYDPASGILLTRAKGRLGFDEIVRHLDEQQEAQRVANPELIDATGANTAITADQVRILVERMTEMQQQGTFGPTAVITSNDVVFGMARMFGILSELRGGPKLEAFRSRNEALVWLASQREDQRAGGSGA